MNNTDTAIVVISTADFYAKTLTNKQLMAFTYAKLGYEVVYVNPLGLRYPRFGTEDISRVLRYLLSFFLPFKFFLKQNPFYRHIKNVTVVYPVTIPRLFDLPPVLRLAISYIVSLQVAFALTKNNKKVLVISYHPFFSLVGSVIRRDLTSILHLVDDLSQLEYIDKYVYYRYLAQNSNQADFILCTNPYLARQVSSVVGLSTKIYLEPNRVSFQNKFHPTFNSPRPNEHNVLLVATLTESKVDFDCLQLSLKSLQGRLLVVGKVDVMTKTRSIDLLLSDPRVDYLGEMNMADIARLATRCNYGLICNTQNEYNMSSTPMKFLDYVNFGLMPIARVFPYLSMYSEFSRFLFTNQHTLSALFKRLPSVNSKVLRNQIKKNFAKIPRFTYDRRIRDLNELLTFSVPQHDSTINLFTR